MTAISTSLLMICNRICCSTPRNVISFFCARQSYATKKYNSSLVPDGPSLKDFIMGASGGLSAKDAQISSQFPPYIDPSFVHGRGRNVYFDVHGCQMNVNDTEIVWSILESAGFSKTEDISRAHVILMMTCAIRDNAEKKIWNKLEHYKHMKRKRTDNQQLSVKIGILGCMAERLKDRLLEKEGCIDLVCGPDSYKDLPRLLALTEGNQRAINILLSLEETYADVVPVRLNQDSVTAYVSIMRGCDNMCSYCIVPFTRGRERSRPVDSILSEVDKLSQQGIKDITLLGQNVNSYRDVSGRGGDVETELSSPGFRTVYKSKRGGLRFAQLLDLVAQTVPQDVRIRFTSPHPKDFPIQVLETMASHENICKSIHLPAQSGSDTVLDMMRRGYTRRTYLDLVATIRSILPSVTLSSDFICGFCSETEEQFQQTLHLIEEVKYNVAYLFAYSMREKTTAHRRYKDDVPSQVKQDRLLRMIKTFRESAHEANQAFTGTIQTLLIEGRSKRSSDCLQGRTDGNIKVIIPACSVPISPSSHQTSPIQKGHYVSVRITDSNSQGLKGDPLYQNRYNLDIVQSAL